MHWDDAAKCPDFVTTKPDATKADATIADTNALVQKIEYMEKDGLCFWQVYHQLTREEQTALYKSGDNCAAPPATKAVGNENEDLDGTAAEEHIAPECRKCSNCQEFDYGTHGTTMQQMCLEHSLACIKDAEDRKLRRNPPGLSL